MLEIQCRKILTDRAPDLYLEIPSYEEYRDRLYETGLIDKDKNSPGRCWLRSLYPNEPELP